MSDDENVVTFLYCNVSSSSDSLSLVQQAKKRKLAALSELISEKTVDPRQSRRWVTRTLIVAYHREDKERDAELNAKISMGKI